MTYLVGLRVDSGPSVRVGKCLCPNGSVTTGHWVFDERCGVGNMVHVNGDVIVGSWKEDRCHVR